MRSMSVHRRLHHQRGGRNLEMPAVLQGDAAESVKDNKSCEWTLESRISSSHDRYAKTRKAFLMLRVVQLHQTALHWLATLRLPFAAQRRSRPGWHLLPKVGTLHTHMQRSRTKLDGRHLLLRGDLASPLQAPKNKPSLDTKRRLYGLACCTRCSSLVLRARCGGK